MRGRLLLLLTVSIFVLAACSSNVVQSTPHYIEQSDMTKPDSGSFSSLKLTRQDKDSAYISPFALELPTRAADRSSVPAQSFNRVQSVGADWSTVWPQGVVCQGVSAMAGHIHTDRIVAPGKVACDGCGRQAYASTFMPDPDLQVFACGRSAQITVPVLVHYTEFVGATLGVQVSENVKLTGISSQGTMFEGYTAMAAQNILLNAGSRPEGNFTQNGVIVYLTLTATEPLKEGDSVQIALSSKDIASSLGANQVVNIAESCYFGQVTYTVRRPIGDIDGNGIIDAVDVRLLTRYTDGWPADYYEEHLQRIELYGDVSGDGRIDEQDAALLSHYIHGWKTTLWD